MPTFEELRTLQSLYRPSIPAPESITADAVAEGGVEVMLDEEMVDGGGSGSGEHMGSDNYADIHPVPGYPQLGYPDPHEHADGSPCSCFSCPVCGQRMFLPLTEEGISLIIPHYLQHGADAYYGSGGTGKCQVFIPDTYPGMHLPWQSPEGRVYGLVASAPPPPPPIPPISLLASALAHALERLASLESLTNHLRPLAASALRSRLPSPPSPPTSPSTTSSDIPDTDVTDESN